jgi:hypothetical protein
MSSTSAFAHPMIEQYRMFITGGDRIVLVDPDTREVVDVIEVE